MVGIAAAKYNRIGVVGVAPGGNLWAVKVLNNQNKVVVDKSLGTRASVINGLEYVKAMPVK